MHILAILSVLVLLVLALQVIGTMLFGQHEKILAALAGKADVTPLRVTFANLGPQPSTLAKRRVTHAVRIRPFQPDRRPLAA